MQKGFGLVLMKLSTKWQAKATEYAIASTGISLNNSPLEGNKLAGGSIIELGKEEEEGLGRFGEAFGRFLGLGSIDLVRNCTGECVNAERSY